MNICVLFDMDGVLIDTEPQYSAFWKGIAEEYNIETINFENKVKGMTIPHIIKLYFNQLSSSQVENILNKFKTFEENVLFPDIPGALNFLDELRYQGIKIALVTSSSELKLNRVLQLKHFDTIFDVIVSAKDIENSKPAPDCFLLGAKKCNISPEFCIVFEDSLAGITAGNTAGMIVVGLSTTHPESELIGKCVKVIPDFRDISVEYLISLIPNIGK